MTNENGFIDILLRDFNNHKACNDIFATQNLRKLY